MVKIKIEKSLVEMEITGLHIIWAFKKKLTFNKKNIKNAQIADRNLRPAPFRIPGTYVPGIIAAGTYLGKGRKEFWDTTFKANAIEIELNNEKYTKIVVNVDDPKKAVSDLLSR